MDLKTLRAELQKLAALAEGWDVSPEILDIERDLALEKLRNLYDALRFGLAPAAQPSQTDALKAGDLSPVEIDLDTVMPPAEEAAAFGASGVAPSGEPAVPEMTAGIPAQTPAEVVPEGIAAAVTEEPAGEMPEQPAAEKADAPAAEAAVGTVPEEPSVVADPPAADGASLRLFEMAPVDAKRAKHRVVLSLYGDSEPVGPVCPASRTVPSEPIAEEQAVPQPAPEAAVLAEEAPAADPAAALTPAGEPVAAAEIPPAVLGETLNADVTTVSDLIAVAAPQAAVGQEPVTDLRRALCNNDRFLLARDLFGGDMAACERTVGRLNEFDDLDECMLYIAENFDWNPHTDGAKLLVDLIERKLA